MTDQPIILVQFPRHLGIPNASPFCAKLELWLKLAEIPFEIKEQVMPNSAPKRKFLGSSIKRRTSAIAH